MEKFSNLSIALWLVNRTLSWLKNLEKGLKLSQPCERDPREKCINVRSKKGRIKLGTCFQLETFISFYGVLIRLEIHQVITKLEFQFYSYVLIYNLKITVLIEWILQTPPGTVVNDLIKTKTKKEQLKSMWLDYSNVTVSFLYPYVFGYLVNSQGPKQRHHVLVLFCLTENVRLGPWH